jgi:hypothetical protein
MPTRRQLFDILSEEPSQDRTKKVQHLTYKTDF